ncbi:uncharacterized protein [Macrobrachium rosenbergii]|uniref:uncharacterized protein isoform X2 n=1 Tax=Macrobrachium rosenbergii TaxID=79674 RepID=UPI0034D7B9FA
MVIDMWIDVILLALLWSAHSVTAVTKDTLKVKVPRVAFIGQDVELECTFPWTDPNSLYSIKWWRDNDQFYQYIPKNAEPKKSFEVKGIRVILQKSTEFKVSLRNLSLDSSGAFTCEVMSDENFETLRKSANMTVIDPPDGEQHGEYGPVIKVRGWNGIGPLEVRDGQRVEALCQARNVYPHAILTWYHNGTEVPRESVANQTNEMVGFKAVTSSLKLRLNADQLWDEQGRVLLQCAAEIPGLFHEMSVLELHNPVLRRARLTGLFASGHSARPSTFLMASAAILSVQLLRVTVLSPWL